MSFYGSSFSYDGTSSEEFGLMLYDFNTTTQGNSEFATGVNIREDRIPSRYRSLFYGAELSDNLKFNLVFGADEYSAGMQEDIDRPEMEVIGSWLTGKNGYRWLSIDQEDMFGVRYRCIITDLKMIEFSGFKWAFQCVAHCDSPFAYTFPFTTSFNGDGSGQFEGKLFSRSSYNGYYYPSVEIELNSPGSFSIINETDDGYEFKIEDYPNKDLIKINGENGIITTSSGINPYPYCNFKFPRLLRGDNRLKFMGDGSVRYTCEFPVNVGG